MSEAYYVVRVNNGSGIISVRKGSDIEKGIPLNQFRHGGSSSNLVVPTTLKGPFANPDDATRAVAGMIERGSLRKAFVTTDPRGSGEVANVEGSRTTIDDKGHINFLMLRGLVAR